MNFNKVKDIATKKNLHKNKLIMMDQKESQLESYYTEKYFKNFYQFQKKNFQKLIIHRLLLYVNI